jgi:vacuolar-type H+-ATPase subunit I/STV1
MEQDSELNSLVAQQLISEVNQFLTSYEQYENTYDIGRIQKIQSEMDKYEEQRERFFDECQSINSDIERQTNKNDSKGLGGMLQGLLKTGPTKDELKLKQEECTERLAKIDIDIQNLRAKKTEVQEDIKEKMRYNRKHIQRLINTTDLIMFLITTPPPQEESTKCCSCVRRGGKTKRVRRLQSKSKNKSRR